MVTNAENQVAAKKRKGLSVAGVGLSAVALAKEDDPGGLKEVGRSLRERRSQSIITTPAFAEAMAGREHTENTPAFVNLSAEALAKEETTAGKDYSDEHGLDSLLTADG